MDLPGLRCALNHDATGRMPGRQNHLPLDTMNLQAFLNRGARHAPSDADRRRAKITVAAEASRKQWLDALMADEIRAWMGMGQQDREAITGMITMLAIAGFAHAHDVRDIDAPEIRIIRGAISAADQCLRTSGGVISHADAQAFSAAAGHARRILQSASVDGIVTAASAIRGHVGLSS